MDTRLSNSVFNDLAHIAWLNREKLAWINEDEESDMLRETSEEARMATYIDLDTGEFSEANYENDIPAYEIVLPNLYLDEENYLTNLLYRGAFLDQLATYGYDTRHPVLAPGAYGPTGFSGVRFRQTNASA